MVELEDTKMKMEVNNENELDDTKVARLALSQTLFRGL